MFMLLLMVDLVVMMMMLILMITITRKSHAFIDNGENELVILTKISPQAKFGNDEKESDVILHGYIKKLVSWSHHTFYKYWTF